MNMWLGITSKNLFPSDVNLEVKIISKMFPGYRD